jgi:hypothetical protein
MGAWINFLSPLQGWSLGAIEYEQGEKWHAHKGGASEKECP